MAKKPERMSSVGPTAITKTISSSASAMLISDRRLTPASRPATTEASAIAVMPITSTIWVVLPSGTSKRKLRPELACEAP